MISFSKCIRGGYSWRRKLFCAGFGLTIWLGQGLALAAGGGKPATKLVNVADTRAISSGFVKWTGDLYNHSYWLYALLTVTTMAAMGLGLGLVSDKAIGLLGIKMGKMDHHE